MTARDSTLVRVSSADWREGDPTLRLDDAVGATIEWLDADHAILAEAPAGSTEAATDRSRLWIGPARRLAGGGITTREVIVDGWRIEVELEDDRRATLRRRAARTSGRTGSRAMSEVRAALPGRVASVAVATGDRVAAGQALVVIEAMKMLNEVRAVQAGVVQRVLVEPGQAVELGDVLVILV